MAEPRKNIFIGRVINFVFITCYMSRHYWFITWSIQYTVYSTQKKSNILPQDLNIYKFKVCKSVHHQIQINHQLDTTISPVLYLTFIYSSTCFGRPHAHHQELNNCISCLWYYRWSVVVAVLLVVVSTNSTAISTLQS